MDDDRPYRERPEWNDVTPVLQDDGPEPLAVIRYPHGFEEVHNYFRAVQQRNELSERALALTNDVIEHNSANYTAWWYRRLCLKNLNSDLNEELKFTDEWGKNSPKNYQVWYHRRWLIGEIEQKLPPEQKTQLAQDELSYLEEVMKENEDYKNYNGWSHRQFVVQRFGLWHEELPFLENLLKMDVRNNSAWNHRYYTVKNQTWPFTDEVRKREVQFALETIRTVPHNESAWNYIAGFLGNGEGRVPWDRLPEVEALSREVVTQTQDSTGVPCRHALEVLANVSLARGDTAEALKFYAQLSETDKIRGNYWKWKADQAERKKTMQ